MKNSDQAEVLLKKLQENAIDLVQDPYGNYAVTELIIVRYRRILLVLEMGATRLQTNLWHYKIQNKSTQQLEVLF